eukprot:TRINITY_DN3262_c0_g1_i1.p1 TRINITY_DN3262_c0_g1~~TRINITY_DN3262_c0_g1_i1.p1  ORF type:complete len:340 (+),score=115.51 TRINITY_DN3262_c0_g1_i1:147-1022(+)
MEEDDVDDEEEEYESSEDEIILKLFPTEAPPGAATGLDVEALVSMSPFPVYNQNGATHQFKTNQSPHLNSNFPSSNYNPASNIGRTIVQPTIRVYNLNNYSFGKKEAQPEKDATVPARLARMQAKYEKEGMRRTVEGVLIVHVHNHPHVLLLQIENSHFFKLPGGRLKPGEEDIPGLKSKLTTKIASTSTAPNGQIIQNNADWEVGDLLCSWWRPNFETLFYPYIPPHITKPKELKKLYLIVLPESFMFDVPKNLQLLAVPIFDLYDNGKKYGPVISSLPQLLGRFNFVYL